MTTDLELAASKAIMPQEASLLLERGSEEVHVALALNNSVDDGVLCCLLDLRSEGVDAALAQRKKISQMMERKLLQSGSGNAIQALLARDDLSDEAYKMVIASKNHWEVATLFRNLATPPWVFTELFEEAERFVRYPYTLGAFLLRVSKDPLMPAWIVYEYARGHYDAIVTAAEQETANALAPRWRGSLQSLKEASGLVQR